MKGQLLSVTVPEGYDAPELQAKSGDIIGLVHYNPHSGKESRVRVHHVDGRTIYFYPEAHALQ